LKQDFIIILSNVVEKYITYIHEMGNKITCTNTFDPWLSNVFIYRIFILCLSDFKLVNIYNVCVVFTNV